MPTLRILLGLAMLGFIASFIWAGAQKNLGHSLHAMANDPWGAVTLLELYASFLFFGAWLALIEPRRWKVALWVLAILLLGHFISVLYLFLRSLRVESPRELLLPQQHAG